MVPLRRPSTKVGVGGVVLFLAKEHVFHTKMGFRRGANNLAKLLSLKAILVFYKDKGCDKGYVETEK